jgi:hypothetical protein
MPPQTFPHRGHAGFTQASEVLSGKNVVARAGYQVQPPTRF